MAVVIIIIGVLIAIGTFASAAILEPASAPQQAVQELRYVLSMLGLILVALGLLLENAKQRNKHLIAIAVATVALVEDKKDG